MIMQNMSLKFIHHQSLWKVLPNWLLWVSHERPLDPSRSTGMTFKHVLFCWSKLVGKRTRFQVKIVLLSTSLLEKVCAPWNLILKLRSKGLCHVMKPELMRNMMCKKQCGNFNLWKNVWHVNPLHSLFLVFLDTKLSRHCWLIKA